MENGNENIENEIEFEEPSGWLLSHDILETIGYSGGFVIFLAILALILYLKCRNKRTSTTTFVPLFDNLRLNVQMVGDEPKFEPLHQPSGYAAVAQPQPEESQNWGNSCHQMTFTEDTAACQQTSEQSHSVKRDKKDRIRQESQSHHRDHSSLISTVVRTA